jgi:Concanavalin A-like lectin/glucanases superfamily
MHTSRFLPVLTAVLAGAASPCTAALVGHWTFDGGSLADSTGNFGNIVLQGNASIINGALDVNGAGTNASGWAATSGSGGAAIANKTLVSWITLESLSGSAVAGSAMSLDSTTVDQFDGIVFAERDANRWMNGSSNFNRSPAGQFDQPAALETSTGTLIQLAITYEDLGGGNVQITGYRDGTLMGSYSSPGFVTWAAGNQEVIFGKRHLSDPVNGPGALDALIHEARLYDTALSQTQIQALVMVPEPAVPVLGAVALGLLGTRRRRDRR